MSTPWVMLIVGLWAAVLLLAAAVVGLMRRLREFENGMAASPRREHPFQLRVGAQMPALPELKGRPEDGVLLFLSSKCAACQRLAASLRIGRGRAMLAGLQATLVTDIEGAELYADLAVQSSVVQRDNETVAALGIPATPYAVAVSSSGVIVAADLVPNIDALSRIDAVRNERPPRGRAVASRANPAPVDDNSSESDAPSVSLL